MGPIQHEESPGVAAFSRLDEFQRFAILKAQDPGAEWPKNERRVNAGLVTLAGVTCNENLEVMNASTDEPIGGLWAAGNCLGGRYGTGYATPFAGNSIGMAMIHGRVAGKLATGQAVL
ncbi:MAG: FAD-binding protein [Berryella intestinalis]|uniref:FAD-binding protein n=1 Tax=Berryella intestinalis TaxID=1531429 RepID=UPI002A52FAF1|nr:FAD-binding protein [Berryella intestinalis]MDD7368545.1 FAD-binding protein [Berryella intestinalis]MDY3129110.1 FAD-binding protein [Berryella intestinalis]